MVRVRRDDRVGMDEGNFVSSFEVSEVLGESRRTYLEGCLLHFVIYY